MTPQVLDISHHNVITSRAQVPDLPIVHKVNEGTAIDREVRDRLPWIAGRTEIFGGYTVLIVSKSTIREQLERYADIIGPHWRDGATTQLDIEPWERYDRPVSAEEIIEAGVVHDELFGPDRFLAYINPNQLPQQYAALDRAGWLDGRLWLPNYSRNGATQAAGRGAVLHQYTSTAPVAGFAHGIAANTILQPERLAQIANLTKETTMPARYMLKPPPQVPGGPWFLIDGLDIRYLNGIDRQRELAAGTPTETETLDRYAWHHREVMGIAPKVSA